MPEEVVQDRGLDGQRRGGEILHPERARKRPKDAELHQNPKQPDRIEPDKSVTGYAIPS